MNTSSFRILAICFILVLAVTPTVSISQENQEKETSSQTEEKSESKIDKVARRKAAREKADKIEKQGKPARYPYKSSVEMPADM